MTKHTKKEKGCDPAGCKKEFCCKAGKDSKTPANDPAAPKKDDADSCAPKKGCGGGCKCG